MEYLCFQHKIPAFKSQAVFLMKVRSNFLLITCLFHGGERYLTLQTDLFIENIITQYKSISMKTMPVHENIQLRHDAIIDNSTRSSVK